MFLCHQGRVGRGGGSGWVRRQVGLGGEVGDPTWDLDLLPPGTGPPVASGSSREEGDPTVDVDLAPSSLEDAHLQLSDLLADAAQI